jgi:hypothetical protein
MKPLRRFALAHAAQPPLHHWERIRLQVDQDTQQPILGRGPRTVRRGRVPTGGTRPPIEAPFRHLRFERGLKGWDQALKRIEGETGQIEDLCRVGLDLSEPSTPHGGGLLSPEAQDTINRDELYLNI